MNTLLVTLLAAVPVGQPPGSYYSALANYNYNRAYQQFLSSPSGLKTFSSLGEGYRMDTFTPFSHLDYYQGPSYEHQRIGPSGWERYNWVPGHGSDYQTPFFGGGYGVPGHGVYSYTPPYSSQYPPPYPGSR